MRYSKGCDKSKLMLHSLIVIYNKKCEDSLSLQYLLKSSKRSDIDIIIFDNSTAEFNNERYCLDHDITYYGFKKNLGLSKAYNYVIDQLDDNSGYLMILDDDTLITDSYIEEVFHQIERGHANELFLPIVYAGSFILSPSNVKYRSGVRAIKNIDQIDINKITAINSGMIVGLKIYKTIRYNENLFLDCVDHDFMYEIRDSGVSIIILSSIIEQNYSRNTSGNIDDSVRKRFSLFKKDFFVYSKKRKGLFFYIISILKHSIEQSIKYHNLFFIYDLFSIIN